MFYGKLLADLLFMWWDKRERNCWPLSTFSVRRDSLAAFFYFNEEGGGEMISKLKIDLNALGLYSIELPVGLKCVAHFLGLAKWLFE